MWQNRLSVRTEGGGGVSTPIPTIHNTVILGTYEAAIAELSHTFNFVPALTRNVYTKILFTVQGQVSVGAALALQMRLNLSALTNYHDQYLRISVGGTLTGIGVTSQTQWEIGSAIMFTANVGIFCDDKIIMPTDFGLQDVAMFHSAYSPSSAISESGSHGFTAAITDISDIEIRATNTWRTGTKINLLGILRDNFQGVPP